MKTMNAGDFYRAVAEETGVSIAQTKAIFTAGLDVLKDALKRGDKVQFIGFGTFEVKERAARTGRNPATGETIEIAASKYPSFSAGSALKAKLN